MDELETYVSAWSPDRFLIGEDGEVYGVFPHGVQRVTCREPSTYEELKDWVKNKRGWS